MRFAVPTKKEIADEIRWSLLDHPRLHVCPGECCQTGDNPGPARARWTSHQTGLTTPQQRNLFLLHDTEASRHARGLMLFGDNFLLRCRAVFDTN